MKLTDLKLATPRMLIRTVSAQDRERWIEAFRVGRDTFARWFPTPPAIEALPDLFEQDLQHAEVYIAEATQCRLIGVLPDGRIAGFFNLSQIVHGAFHNAYASWSVTPPLAGMGYGTEGVGAMLDIAFAPLPAGLGLHRVQANIIPDNIASLRLAEKTGFRPRGAGKAVSQDRRRVAGSHHVREAGRGTRG